MSSRSRPPSAAATAAVPAAATAAAAVTAASSSSSTPTAGVSYQRRGVVNYDNYIDVILAARIKKVTFHLPSVSQQYLLDNTFPHVLHLPNEDFAHFAGEVDGRKYDYPSRPEIDLLLINASYDREHEAMLEVNYDPPVLVGSRDNSRPVSASQHQQPPGGTGAGAAENTTRPPTAGGGGGGGTKPATPAASASRPPSAKDRYEHEKVHHNVPKTHKLDEGAVLVLYDAAKQLIVLNDQTIINLMKLHTLHIPEYRAIRREMFGEMDIILPQIDEEQEFVEEKKMHPRHIEIVIVRSYLVLGKDMINTFEKKREKLWRRFLRRYIPTWFQDITKLDALKESIQLDIQMEEKRRQEMLLPIIETDQNSTDSSVVKKKKKKKGAKKAGKDKEKDGKGKKSKGKDVKKKGKTVAATDDEEDDDEDDEESEIATLPQIQAKPSSPPNNITKPASSSGRNTPTSPSGRRK